jgi:hypothetical protein
MNDAYEQWAAGRLNAWQAARAIWSDLREVQSEQLPLQAQERALRACLYEIVAQLGAPLEIAKFGILSTIASTRSASYARERLDALVAQLSADGATLISQAEVAQRIAVCRKETLRAAYLRIDAGAHKRG